MSPFVEYPYRLLAHWLKLIAWAAAEELALEILASDRAGEFYEVATRGRSTSHHLQVKATMAPLQDILGAVFPGWDGAPI